MSACLERPLPGNLRLRLARRDAREDFSSDVLALVLNFSPLHEHGISGSATDGGISGLVVEYIVAIDVTRVRFPADAFTQ